jgi:hypothetical protein
MRRWIVDELVERIKEWAHDKADLHHRFAVEDEHLRVEHIAASSAYRTLASEVAALAEDRLSALPGSEK